MSEGMQIRNIALGLVWERKALHSFLLQHALRLEEDVELAFGIFDEQECLLGCGCAAQGILKCFAIDARVRGANWLGQLVSALVADRFATGYFDIFIFTKPEHSELFMGCGFFLVGQTEQVALLENHRDGISRYLAALKEGERCPSGAIVMNCNPFTRGHRYLIEEAAKQCERLHIFVVEEDRSDFSTQARFDMVLQGTADLPTVRVHKSGRYILSHTTFPSYFLKRAQEATLAQTELDCEIFARWIAPPLMIHTRFVGTEPYCEVTAQYHQTMKKALGSQGITLCEIPRICHKGIAISASQVRERLRQSGLAGIDVLLPQTTLDFLRSPAGEKELKRLQGGEKGS